MSISIRDELLRDIDRDTRRFTFRILQNVVVATPVDTGRARANWQVSSNNPIVSQIDGVDRGGTVTVNNARLSLDAQRNARAYWITNNLPYIGRLNEGHSQQAPAMFVETGIARANRDGA